MNLVMLSWLQGAGTLGLGMIGAAKLKNPGVLIAIDLMPKRLEVAKKLGADIGINPSETDAVQEDIRLDGRLWV